MHPLNACFELALKSYPPLVHHLSTKLSTTAKRIKITTDALYCDAVKRVIHQKAAHLLLLFLIIYINNNNRLNIEMAKELKWAFSWVRIAKHKYLYYT